MLGGSSRLVEAPQHGVVWVEVDTQSRGFGLQQDPDMVLGSNVSPACKLPRDWVEIICNWIGTVEIAFNDS